MPATDAVRWTPEDDEILRQMVQDGKSASMIAERLRRSRSAVCGRMKRLGVSSELRKKLGIDAKARLSAKRMEKLATTVPRAAEPKPPKPKPVAAMKPAERHEYFIGEAKTTTEIIRRMDKGENLPTRVQLLDARRDQCRFPDGGTFVCGAPVRDPLCSYCETHTRSL